MSTPDTDPQAVAPHLDSIMALLPPNARSLVEAGNGSGLLARRYKQSYPACFYQSVERQRETALAAQQYANHVHLANLDAAPDAFFRQLAQVDGWIFNTTLETLTDPGRLLARVRASLPIDACVLACIANTRHWAATALPEPGRQPAMEMAAALSLFSASGLRVTTGLALAGAPMPAQREAQLRAAAADAGHDPEQACQLAWPSHFLIKAMPA